MNDSTKRSGAGSVEETARDFWATRPVRPRQGGKVGGVCVALGRRYGVDPVLLRVGFAVGAFYGGAGLLLYLIGWLILPKEVESADGTVGSRPTSTPIVLLILCMLVPVSFIVWDFPGIVGLVAGVGGLYLLQRHRSNVPAQVDGPATRPPGAMPTGAPESSSAAPTGNAWVYPGATHVPYTGYASPGDGSESDNGGSASAAQQGGPVENETVRTQPPAWDPLGAAPFAWDLPDPGSGEPEPEPDPEPPARRSVTLVTAGLALLTGGLGFAMGLGPAAALAAALGVLGLGMIVGAFLHGGRGLVGFAIPVGALAIALSFVPSGPWQGLSNQVERPNSVEQVRSNYAASVGNVELHLDELRMPPDGTVSTGANVGLGNITVYVPENVDVNVNCDADRGHVQCLGNERAGRDVSAQAEDLGADGPGGGRLNLDLTVGTGNVEVHRV